MKSAPRLALMAGCLMGIPAAGSFAAEEEDKRKRTVAEALKGGEYGIALRYRYEDVSQDTFELDAYASTLRTAVSYRSAAFRGWDIGLELENVTDIGAGSKHDNAGAGSLGNGVTDRPVIADPEITEIHQAYVGFRGLPGTTIRAGRQELRLGNQRYVGATPWRQNHQSFDSVRIEQTSLENVHFSYAYLARANVATGANRSLDGHALRVAIRAGDHGTATPYAYRFDFDSAADAGVSTQTYGVSWVGSERAGNWQIPYRVELARQTDTGSNPDDVRADYLEAEVSFQREGFTATLGYELLGGSPADGAFNTPLAARHGPNGWADKFLVTPVNGLTDLRWSLGYAWEQVELTIVGHQFGADSSGSDHGSELDGLLTYRSDWGQLFAVKFALFDAKAAGTYDDTRKVWVWTGYSF